MLDWHTCSRQRCGQSDCWLSVNQGVDGLSIKDINCGYGSTVSIKGIDWGNWLRESIKGIDWGNWSWVLNKGIDWGNWSRVSIKGIHWGNWSRVSIKSINPHSTIWMPLMHMIRILTGNTQTIVMLKLVTNYFFTSIYHNYRILSLRRSPNCGLDSNISQQPLPLSFAALPTFLCVVVSWLQAKFKLKMGTGKEVDKCAKISCFHLFVAHLSTSFPFPNS